MPHARIRRERIRRFEDRWRIVGLTLDTRWRTGDSAVLERGCLGGTRLIDAAGGARAERTEASVGDTFG